MKKITKILVVFHNSILENGATRSLTDILNYLIDKNKYQVDVIFPNKNGSAIEYYKNKGCKVYYYKYGNLIQNMNHSIFKRIVKFPLLMYRYLSIKHEVTNASKELIKNNYDVIYSNTSSIIFGGLLGKKIECKQVWHIREYRTKDHQFYFFLGENKLKKIINMCADRVFFVSKSVMADHLNIIDRNKCIVTYNSYSKDFVCPKKGFNINNKLNILIAGDIRPSKNQFDVIKAMSLIKDENFYLHIAGKIADSDYYKEMLDFINEEKMNEKIKFYGQVKNMNELRSTMDIGIVPSVNEAFGRTTIEGMLSMLAMIGRASGGTVEQISDKKNGLLYDGTIEDLVNKLLYFYNNRDEMKKIAIEGFNYAKENFTNGECARIVENVIDELLSNE